MGLAALGAGAAAVVIARRRGAFDWEEGLIGEDLFPSVPRVAREISMWIAGPAGHLYVRDGGDLDRHPSDDLDLPILFVHGLGGNGGQWVLQLDHLRPTRRAVALDLRGHGESDPAENGDYSIAGFAQDILAVADELGLRRFVLVGHSFGALPAIEVAGTHPERVAGLLLVDPNGDQTRLDATEAQVLLGAVRRDPLGVTEEYFRQLLVGGDREAATWILEDLRATDSAAIVGGLEAAASYSPTPALARYVGPKLSAISSINDLPISLHRLLPELPVHLVGGAGHWLQLDRPEAFERVLDRFLDEVESNDFPSALDSQ